MNTLMGLSAHERYWGTSLTDDGWMRRLLCRSSIVYWDRWERTVNYKNWDHYTDLRTHTRNSID
jgi:hypothetical protein